MEDEKSNKSLNVYVSWKDLSFKVPHPKKKNQMKTILRGLNGHINPGECVAVIGPSGSGKSSFLNCISGRNFEGVTGDILFNGVPRPINFARFTGYVIQDDVYFESLTVKETLKFSANLKLSSKDFTKQQKMERVESIIDELDLHKCQDTIIGQVGKGISGGERRRLAIGLEIINKPSLLLLDEPTSGLDSASALMVGRILKKLATTMNITVLCTVHQPRYSLTAMFDKLYFLGKGFELYFGPSVPNCLLFFENAGYKCPEYENPADFLLDLVNTTNQEGKTDDDDDNQSNDESRLVEMHSSAVALTDKNTKKAEKALSIGSDVADDDRTKIILELAEAYASSEYRTKALDYTVPSEMNGSIVFGSISSEFYITPIYNQIWVISLRSFLHKWREPIATMTQAFNALIMPVLFGSVYWQLDLSQQQAFDRISAIALIILMLAFFAFDILMLFPVEREIFNREQASGMYRPISFFIGRTVAETPQHIILVWIMGTIAYWMYGLQASLDKYLTFQLIAVSMVVSATGLLLAFSAWAKNLEQSNLLATVFLLIFMLFDGNWISLDKVPAGWSWVPHISCMAYGSQAAIANEYRGLEFKCTQHEIDNGECYLLTGEDVLTNRGLDDVDVTFNIIMLWVLAGVYRLIAWFGFWLLFRNHKPTTIIKHSFGCK